MITVKDTQRATVQVCFDGSVRKTFLGPRKEERFANEVRILRHLEQRGCDFVPRIIHDDPETLLLVTTNCGQRVDRLDPERCREIFAELGEYGVRHDDPEIRNVTYRPQDGRFCLIDFEFAELVEPTAGRDQARRDQAKKSSPVAPANPLPPLTWSGCSEQGPVRPNNEDTFLALAIDERDVRRLGKEGHSNGTETDLLVAVSDGMGGEQSGEFASTITADKITRMLPPLIRQQVVGTPIGFARAFHALYREINKALLYLGQSYEECRGMGATLSLCWFSGKTMHFAHIGDSRIYHLPASGGIIQLTNDDTHVGWLQRTGQISEREAKRHPAKNRLQKALGAGNQFVDPQVGQIASSPGDRFLLCTDGVTDALLNEAIRGVLDERTGIQTPATHLVAAALERSGSDNTTAVVVAVGSQPGVS